MDDYFHYSWIYFLKFKHEIFEKFLEFQAMVENIFHHNIKILQYDNGKDYVHKKFSALYSQTKIIQRFSCPHTSQQNGIAKRKYRHLSNII